MYLALFQDLIAVGGQYDSVQYSYGNVNSQQMSMNFDRESKNTGKTEERHQFIPPGMAKPLRHEGRFPESQNLAHPIAEVPSICLTTPDSTKPEPLNYRIFENHTYDGNDSISDDHEEPNSNGWDISRKEDPNSALRTDTMEKLSCSPYQHDVESLTRDYEDWLKSAQGAVRETDSDDLAGSARGRVGPSKATCQELILWKPEPTIASRKASARFSMGRKFSLDWPMVYPFRKQRNSV